MKRLRLLPIGKLDGELLKHLGMALSASFRVPYDVISPSLDPEFAFHGERQQYHSSEILYRMQTVVSSDTWRVLGVTSVDLYIPILTFVFGEAQMGGPCSLVSLHRLRQEFYGLPFDHKMLRDRLVKEAVHELGHSVNLAHCDDYGCAMAASHAVEWIDLKSAAFCQACQSKITQERI